MLKCGSQYCPENLAYILLKKKVDKVTFWYAGVLCEKCCYTHRISLLYHKREEAVNQVVSHNERILSC